MTIRQWPLSIRIFWQLIALFVLWMQVPVRETVVDGKIQKSGWLYQLQPPLNETANDFFQEWSSARNWWTGRPIYQHMKQNLADYVPVRLEDVKIELQYNAHPPPSVVLVLPLGKLDFLSALAVWHVLSLILLAAAIFLLAKELRIKWQPDYAWLILPTVGLLSFCNPLKQQFNQGQLNALLLFLFVGGWVASARQYTTWAGIAIGLAAAIKIFPGFLLLYFLLRKQYRAIVAGCVTLLVCAGGSALLLGTNAITDYAQTVVPALKPFRCSWMNHSVLGVWHRLFVGEISEGVRPFLHQPRIAWGATFVSAAVLVFLLLRFAVKSSSKSSWDQLYWLFVTVMLLLGPLTWDHSLLLLMPAVVLFCRTSNFCIPPKGGSAYALIGILAFFWLSPKEIFTWCERLGLLSDPTGPIGLLLIINWPFYMLLGFFLLQLLQMKKSLVAPL
ncbi:MAG: glycosyltransferase family 87 protein [Zavarzinella sp.]